jgi:hypothetical protein
VFRIVLTKPGSFYIIPNEWWHQVHSSGHSYQINFLLQEKELTTPPDEGHAADADDQDGNSSDGDVSVKMLPKGDGVDPPPTLEAARDETTMPKWTRTCYEKGAMREIPAGATFSNIAPPTPTSELRAEYAPQPPVVVNAATAGLLEWMVAGDGLVLTEDFGQPGLVSPTPRGVEVRHKIRLGKVTMSLTIVWAEGDHGTQTTHVSASLPAYARDAGMSLRAYGGKMAGAIKDLAFDDVRAIILVS